MRKTQIAESVLMLVTSRERAAAIAGDLVEESPGRGAWWLWWSVLRTAGSLLWRGLGADPLQLAGLALRGVLLNFALWLAAFVSFVAAGALIFGLLQTAGLVHGDSASFPLITASARTGSVALMVAKNPTPINTAIMV